MSDGARFIALGGPFFKIDKGAHVLMGRVSGQTPRWGTSRGCWERSGDRPAAVGERTSACPGSPSVTIAENSDFVVSEENSTVIPRLEHRPE